jgi:ATP-dependent DNA helicase RecG
MKKLTKHSVQWFYNLIDRGECSFVDFKEQLTDKVIFGHSLKNFSPSYEELAKDVVAFANFKGGFIFIGLVDKTKEVNKEFQFNDEKIYELIRIIQDRTTPSITLTAHKLDVEGKVLIVLEIPFSNQLHRTSKGEYLIRSNDGNRAIEPHQMATIQSEKGLIVYDQKIWMISYDSEGVDKQGVPFPGWQDIEKTRGLWTRISKEKPSSPYLKSTTLEFTETLGLVKEVEKKYWPTTAGILIIGRDKALREFPYNQIKYIRYKEDGSYTPYEFRGDLITMADECFNQLKSEINLKEFNFGLLREYVEDYPEIVLRELLINAIVHRDYSRQQIIEIRKYPGHIEFESPGTFPEGVTELNYLRKTNPRNPNIMDVFREINYAEKAGSGFDKIFTALLTKGKSLPKPIQTDTSVIFKIEAESYSEKLIELSVLYKSIKKKDIDLETILVLNAIYTNRNRTLQELTETPFINEHQLKRILDELLDLEFIETTGKTSGIKYLIHKSKLADIKDEMLYLKHKKQEKAKQEQAILRYLDEFPEIDNESARKFLNLPYSEIYNISRLFSDLVTKGWIKPLRREKQKTFYGKS